ncbi:secondary thiamine-phosphate synthase enzyme YjbQ [Emcibacter nanhaiensis]|uniref:YjbQ family protein n=1 Tax=Emcibacter nanhaiensis TaxID=1505037 RepID=A0A501PH85_9PROT|nr:secondary thiamine-phosphate synthase enzyme YjbQ [Emcibacter nanhaiensis]TPD59226.1 YjbQ family protein [Emcibacter nanhaiensis]
MRQATTQLRFETGGRGLYDVTSSLSRWLAEQNIHEGLFTVHIRHTSASLVIQENADPDVCHDLDNFLCRLVPENDPHYRHVMEGPDDMPAHIRAALTQSQVSLPVIDGRLALGTWQGVYIFEHRRRGHSRTLALHVMGD